MYEFPRHTNYHRIPYTTTTFFLLHSTTLPVTHPRRGRSYANNVHFVGFTTRAVLEIRKPFVTARALHFR